MTQIISLGDWIAKREFSPPITIKEQRRRAHARRAWEFQRRMKAFDNIKRSILGGDSSNPQPKGEPPDAA